MPEHKSILKLLTGSLLFFMLFQYQSQAKIKLGIDVLSESNFEQIKGKKIALLANFASRNNTGKQTLEILKQQKKAKLVKLFTPEHGYYTTISAGDKIRNTIIDGINAISLYGSNRSPTKEQLNDIDAIVVDLQDVGVRSYTYISTLYNIMQVAAEFNKEVIVLDRPNPLGGESFDGNLVEKEWKSFISIAPIPYIHSLTIGEFAQMIIGEQWINKKCKLKVIQMQGWERSMVWEDTKLKWYATSPNVPSIESLRSMAIAGCIGELGIFDMAINNQLPFQSITLYGDKNSFEEKIKLLKPDNLQLQIEFFQKTNIKTEFSIYLDCKQTPEHTYYIYFLHLLKILYSEFPEKFSKIKDNNLAMFRKATGKKDILEKIKSEDDFLLLISEIATEKEKFNKIRTKYLLY